ncbi:oligoendopeptidase F [Alicyclobacillus fastidiosus]|uniref:Oligopeptidase F n=1 Tax=Alicyclobacillus fastidiosus TaxID=392011 RepID=A0ABY6ZF42_9BACL|nr:oligoendopeptidase F [Alicyclobacillus fastidiosus]WAH41469.1 oligoendopeptidase F [Alicyclobacillus fastidiosus]
MSSVKRALPLPFFKAEAEHSKKVRTRSEIEDKYKWDLSAIYASDQDWEKDAQKLEQLLTQFAAKQGTLNESSGQLLSAFRLQDEIGQVSGKLYVYAKMHLDEDTSNGAAQALQDRAYGLLVKAQSAMAFFVPEILSIDSNRLEEMLQENRDLQLYRFALKEITREKEHVLSPEQEQLLASFGEVLNAPSDIFSMFNNADMVFPSIRDEDGEEVEITHGLYIQLLESKNREVRKNAFEAVYATYAKHRNTVSAIYSANVKRGVVNARVRKFESARAASLNSDNVPVAVYDNLVNTVHEFLPSLHKYLKLRAKVLGLNDLQMYDLYTPMVQDIDWRVKYDDAKQTVLTAVQVLGEDYRQIAEKGLNSRWVDVYENKGKRSGAYSWGTYGTHPYMLLNYHDSLDNMFTLAHELGHSMHSYFSRKTQPYVYSDYTIFVAEVASTCNEALLLDHLLKTTDDKAKRAYLLNHQLETIRGTLYRQTMFAEFEKLTHEHVEEGGALTTEWLDETYYGLNQEFFGPACNVNEQIAYEWMRIPHFYTPFYVYKYATGISAAIALSRRILSEGEAARNDYLAFLSSGSSDYSIELLRKAGVDMESPEPVREALREFDRLVDELATLVE